MVCDAQYSNCSERAYYGEGANDWEWVRWYFAQEDALDLPFEEAYGFSLWETDVDRSASQVGIPLTPSCYMGQQENIHPGTHWFGPVPYFQEGPPAIALSGPDAFPMCEGEGWASVATPPIGVSSSGIGGEIELRGGVDFGGALFMGTVCWIPYGGCIHLNGGVEFGGALEFSNAGHLELRGGLDLGGALDLGGSGLVLRGGVAFGSVIPAWSSAGIDLRGGVDFGGALGGLTGSGLVLNGGVEFGGFFPVAGGSGITLSGGVELGGALTLEGGTGCSPVPTLVGARIRPVQLSQDEIAFPVGTVGGDTIILFVWEDVSPQIVTLPLGWTTLGGSAPFGWPVSLSAYYRTWDGSGSPGVLVHGAIGHHIKLAVVSVRNNGTPEFGGGDADTTDVQQLATYDVGECPVLLLAGAGCDVGDDPYNTFTGMEDLAAIPPLTPMGLWKRDPAGPGVEGGYLVTPDVPSTWVTVLVSVPPIPM